MKIKGHQCDALVAFLIICPRSGFWCAELSAGGRKSRIRDTCPGV